MAEDTDAEGSDASVDRPRRADDGKDVVVPLRLYKTVTVFSTLFAVVFVLAGFVMLDSATNRATAELSEIDPVLGILGLSSLVFGAAVYAFSTRFRTTEMGKAKDDAAEDSDNG
jgi:hypothetical protein